LDLSYIGVKDIKLNIVTEIGEDRSNLKKFIDNLSTAPKEEKKSNPLDFRLKEVDLSDIFIKIDNKNKGKYQQVTLAGGNIDINYIDLICKDFDLNNILLDRPTYQSHTYEFDCSIVDELSIPQGKKEDSDDVKEPYSLTLREFGIKEGKFGISNRMVIPEEKFKEYLDYNNFYFDDINVLIKDLSIRDDTEIQAKLETLSARDNTGFEIHNIKSDTITINKVSAEFRNLGIEMGNTIIKNYLKLSFADFTSFSDFTKEVVIKADLSNSKLYQIGRASCRERV